MQGSVKLHFKEVSMSRHLFFLPLIILLIVTHTLNARTIYVPTDSVTIQGGINGATDEDTVMVLPGTYYEHDIDFLGKAITVMSTDPEDSAIVAATAVDGDSQGMVFIFQSGEGSLSVLAGLTVTGGYSQDVGGIYCSNASPTITNCAISRNYSTMKGSGMYCMDSSPTITDCIIIGNMGGWAGGIYCYDASPQISRCTILRNDGFTAGGIYLSGFSTTVTIAHCVIMGNVGDYTGGVYSDTWMSSTITDCIVMENSSSDNTGGICCFGNSGTMLIANCTISNNSGKRVGGISCLDGDYVSIANCIIEENHASENGTAGIDCYETNPTITNCIIAGNVGDIGGVNIYSWGTSTVTNCVITGNTGVGAGGIMCHFSEIEPTIITNTVIRGNNVGPEIGGIPNFVKYSNVEGGWSGVGNIDEGPLFITRGGYNYLLRRGSPCIDSGDPTIEDGINWPDWYSNGPRSDMGAYGGPGNVGWLQ